VALSALLTPLLPEAARYDDRARAALIWIASVGEAILLLAAKARR